MNAMTNPVLDAIASRYSCRDFSDEPLDRETLEALARAGVQAPSSRGGEPWHLAVVTDPSLIAEMADAAYAYLIRREVGVKERLEARGSKGLTYGATAVFVIATKKTRDYTSDELDAGLMGENICLAATSLGVGSCMWGYGTQAFRDVHSPIPQELSAKLGLPWGYEVALTILAGHPGPKASGKQHETRTDAIHYFG
jgi:nitroreductase